MDEKIIHCSMFDKTGYNECGRCNLYEKCALFKRGLDLQEFMKDCNFNIKNK